MDIQEIRAAALQAAAIVHAGDGEMTPAAELTSYADALIPWLGAPPTARMVVRLTIPGTNTDLTSTDGGHMDVNATVDNENVTIVINTEDDKNNPTADQITWAADDNGSLLTPSVSDDTKTYVGTIAGVEGVVNVTASDPTAPNVASFVATITIGAGATSQLTAQVSVN